MNGLTRYVIVFLILTSCSSNDDGSNIAQSLAPTISVNLPEELVYAQTSNFEIAYKRASSCHRFSGFDISKKDNEIIIAVVNSYNTTANNCVTSGELQAGAVLNFVAEREDFYIFKFWQGENTAGENRFLTVRVPVTRPGNE
ncbi:hypothetical protein L1I30_03330 [Gillisia sp. M10.2A]|uniref:Lipoprotein n=1 Tax=Gillisia lutea TaxID=2909668 RepID=A0ABS9ECU1_9FLAO|nr:hypothetical protein [Gillisia lutea]MCF4100691.1 hypothetical protein [Gillisia lutea]